MLQATRTDPSHRVIICFCKFRLKFVSKPGGKWWLDARNLNLAARGVWVQYPATPPSQVYLSEAAVSKEAAVAPLVCVCVCVCVVDTYKYERPIHFRRGSPKRARTAADFIFKFPADVCGVRMWWFIHDVHTHTHTQTGNDNKASGFSRQMAPGRHFQFKFRPFHWFNVWRLCRRLSCCADLFCLSKQILNPFRESVKKRNIQMTTAPLKEEPHCGSRPLSLAKRSGCHDDHQYQ